MPTMGLPSRGNGRCRPRAGGIAVVLTCVLLMVGGCGDQDLADLLSAFSGDGIVKEPLPAGGEAAAPVANRESYGVLFGETLEVAARDGVLANDRYVEVAA